MHKFLNVGISLITGMTFIWLSFAKGNKSVKLIGECSKVLVLKCFSTEAANVTLFGSLYFVFMDAANKLEFSDSLSYISGSFGLVRVHDGVHAEYNLAN